MENRDRPLMVTVQTITFNQERYIRQCLEGIVKQQTNFRFEAIIHDDASTDNTVKIILEYAEKYPDIIKPIIETENQYSKFDGSLARIMLENTKGKYYAVCEGDDYWIDPLKLQKQFDYMESHPQCSMCFHPVYDLLPTGEKKEDKPKVIKDIYGVDDVIMEAGALIRLASTFYRTDFLMTEGYPDFWIKAPIGDYPSTMYYASKGQIGFINDMMSVYRVHAIGAWTSHEKSFNELRQHIKAIYKMFEGFDEYTFGKYHKAVVNGKEKCRKIYEKDVITLFCKKILRCLGVYPFYRSIKKRMV